MFRESCWMSTSKANEETSPSWLCCFHTAKDGSVRSYQRNFCSSIVMEVHLLGKDCRIFSFGFDMTWSWAPQNRWNFQYLWDHCLLKGRIESLYPVLLCRGGRDIGIEIILSYWVLLAPLLYAITLLGLPPLVYGQQVFPSWSPPTSLSHTNLVWVKSSFAHFILFVRSSPLSVTFRHNCNSFPPSPLSLKF